MRGPSPLLAMLVAAVVAPAASALAPSGFPDQCIVAPDGVCQFVCRLNHPLFLFAGGAGGASMACAGGLEGSCSLDPGQACGLDFTGDPRAYGLGTCRGDGHVVVFCGTPLAGPLAGA